MGRWIVAVVLFVCSRKRREDGNELFLSEIWGRLDLGGCNEAGFFGRGIWIMTSKVINECHDGNNKVYNFTFSSFSLVGLCHVVDGAC